MPSNKQELRDWLADMVDLWVLTGGQIQTCPPALAKYRPMPDRPTIHAN